ncbi:hypothetical protein WS88_34735 [Burkholderia cepacia]|nr:hypothetical protein WS88_34735 [Burkholderia cepacia]
MAIVVTPLHAESQIETRQVGVIQTVSGTICENLNAPDPFERGFPNTREGEEEFRQMLRARFPTCPRRDDYEKDAR